MSSDDQILYLNVFGIKLSDVVIYRHVVQIKLVDQKNSKDYILTTMSSRGRGNRSTKQQDNFILVDKLLKKHTKETKNPKRVLNEGQISYAYDGAQTLFTLEPISAAFHIDNEEFLEFEDISPFLKDSITFLKGSIDIVCEPDCEKPSFRQVDFEEWEDTRFHQYLDIVTSQGAIRSGKYLSQSKGLYVYTTHMGQLRAEWALAAKGVHKGCRIVGVEGNPQPILELDPQATQYYAPLTLAEILLSAFAQLFSPNPRRGPVTPNSNVIRAARLLFRDLKCNPFWTDVKKWATNTMIVHDLDYDAPNNSDYNDQYKDLKYPHLPAALVGPQRRRYPLERLRVLPYQSIDRRVLEEFDLTPRANTPKERWDDLQRHFSEFSFNNATMLEFGVQICNDPFQNRSEIIGDRVDKPEINYAQPVHVDDAKRDWKARMEPFSQPSEIDTFMVILIAGFSRNFKIDIDMTKYVATNIANRCTEKGIRINSLDFRSWKNESDADKFLTSVFRELLQQSKNRGSNFSPFVLLVSDDVPNIHECLKFEERMSDIPTQHVLLKNIRKMRTNLENQLKMRKRPFDLTLDNIVMKINIKAGGLNYTSDIPHDIESWKDVPTFVIGLDVAHPDRTSLREGQPSTVGLSCNAVDNPYSFIGDFAYTAPKKETIDDEILRTFISKNISSFASVRGFPKKIIIFRDGVSFGEESEALREAEIIEQTVIAAANDEGFQNYKPSLLVIVVKKRHHTRFYAQGGGQPVNPLPDTAVGGDISEYGKRQIFIQAFRPVQGTAKVPSFNIIRDDDEVSQEHVTKLVCAVCSLHQYVNSPTSIPTPVFVAHELAKRGTGLYKAYKFKNGEMEHDWGMLTCQLSYSTLERLSKVRVY